MRSIRTSPRERVTSRARLTNGRVRVTRPGRRLGDQERRAVVDQMIRDSKLPRANERN